MTMINVKNKLELAKEIATSNKAFSLYLMAALGLGGYKLYSSVLSLPSLKSTKKEYKNLRENVFDDAVTKHLNEISDQLDYLENTFNDIKEEVDQMSNQDETVPEDEPDDPEPTPITPAPVAPSEDTKVDQTEETAEEDVETENDEDEDEEPEVIPVIRKNFWNRQNLRELRILIKRDNMDLVTLKDHFGVPITTIKSGIKELKNKGKLHSEFQVPFQKEPKEKEVETDAVQNSPAGQTANS